MIFPREESSGEINNHYNIGMKNSYFCENLTVLQEWEFFLYRSEKVKKMQKKACILIRIMIEYNLDALVLRVQLRLNCRF